VRLRKGDLAPRDGKYLPSDLGSVHFGHGEPAPRTGMYVFRVNYEATVARDEPILRDGEHVEFKAGDAYPDGFAKDGNFVWLSSAAKAGEPLPLNDGDELMPGPLRSGEIAPRDGVYVFNLTGKEFKLKAGAPFPDGGDPAGDFVFARA